MHYIAVGDTPYYRELMAEIDVLLHEPVGYAVPDELELVERLDVLVNILIFVADPQSYCPGNLMRTQLTSGLQHRYDLRSKPFVPRYPRP
jgi:hypothetical protein